MLNIVSDNNKFAILVFVPKPHKSLHLHQLPESESESELFTGDTSKDNHSPGPVFREVSP